MIELGLEGGDGLSGVLEFGFEGLFDDLELSLEEVGAVLGSGGGRVEGGVETRGRGEGELLVELVDLREQRRCVGLVLTTFFLEERKI